MEPDLDPTENVTAPARLAFPALFEPKPVAKDKPDELKYQAAILFPPDYDMAPLVAAVEAAMIDKWGKVIKLAHRNNPLKKCEDRGGTPVPGYEDGWWYLNAKSNYQPSVLNKNNQEILSGDVVYPGCWCNFHITAFAWSHPKGGDGVSFSLNAVRKYRDDDRLGGRRNAVEVFGAVEVEDLGNEESAGGSDEGINDLLK